MYVCVRGGLQQSVKLPGRGSALPNLGCDATQVENNEFLLSGGESVAVPVKGSTGGLAPAEGCHLFKVEKKGGTLPAASCLGV